MSGRMHVGLFVHHGIYLYIFVSNSYTKGGIKHPPWE